MTWVLQMVMLAFVQCAAGERNEAVKTALKMESATKTLIDNLIAELGQLRRANAEMTMKAELLANEVKRLSPGEEDLGNNEKISKLETVDIKEHKASCASYTKLSTTAGWSCWTGQHCIATGSSGRTAFATTSVEKCPFVNMKLSSEVGNEEAWKCSATSGESEDDAYPWSSGLEAKGNVNHCYDPNPTTKVKGYWASPCLSSFKAGRVSRASNCILRNQEQAC